MHYNYTQNIHKVGHFVSLFFSRGNFHIFGVFALLCLNLSACSSSHSSRDLHASDKVPVSTIDAPYDNISPGSGASDSPNFEPSPFLTNVSDTKERFDRLENVVTSIKQDVDKMVPTVERLSNIEQDLNDVVQHLEVMLTKPQLNGAPQMASSASPTSIAGTPSNNIDIQQISSIRVGEHQEFTRIVVEVSGKTELTTDFAENPKALMIRAPYALAPNKTSGKSKSSLVSNWNVQDMSDQGGTQMSFFLKGDARIVNEMTLSKPTRYVIDIAR